MFYYTNYYFNNIQPKESQCLESGLVGIELFKAIVKGTQRKNEVLERKTMFKTKIVKIYLHCITI